MKKLRLLFSALALLLCSTSLLAHDFWFDGIYYKITSYAGLTVEVTYAGTNASDYDEYSGSVTIPESVMDNGKTYSVTSIGEHAFSYCSELTDVVIPNSVTSIGIYAFSGCSSLTSIVIPNSVTSIGIYAFYDCSSLTSVTIPNSVTYIGENAFSGCSGLTSVTIPNSVTSIGKSAFFGTAWYDNLSDGVVYINDVLYNYKGTMPSGTSIEIKEGTVSISTYAFYRCSGLTSVTIPNSVTNIGYNAFYGCTGLTSVTIPNSVTSIGSSAFDGCFRLTSVTIPNSVTSIGSSVFKDCSGLTSVTIPNSVTSIGGAAFSGCSGLTSVTIPNSVTRIGDNAFYGCKGLTEVNISDFSAWCKIEFENDCANPVYFAQHLLLNGEEIRDLVIPNDVEQIGSFAFFGCPELTSVTIGKNVLSIGENAFDGAELRTVVSLNPEPPTGSGISSTYTYNHATLYVPEDSYWAYAYTKGWGEFIHIKEMAMTDDALASSKAYMIADAKGCNYTVYDAGKDELVNVEYTFALDEENEGACWTVMKDGGESYLYNIGAKKFAAMNEDGKLSLSDAPVNLDITTTESGLSINGNARMFVLNDKVDVDVTAINGITADGIEGADATVYNLQGMKMQNADNLPAGIYIKGGKKFVIK